MRIYIKDKPLRIKRPEDAGDRTAYDVTLDTDDILIDEKKLKGKVLILNATQGIIKSILFILHHKKLKGLDSVTLITPDSTETADLIKNRFRIIKAAGGVVCQGEKVLMIYRLGKWDLPKGKVERKESLRMGAQREVEEECNIKVRVDDKICSTWHTYVQGGSNILKKTTWYRMECMDDSRMKPQVKEGIEHVKWMNPAEVDVALCSTYRSIIHVYKKFRRQQLKVQSV